MQKFKNIYHLLQSLIANIKYGFPARKLTIIGITGTDGKTTTTSMIYHIHKNSGLKVGMISTIFAKIGDEEIDTGMHVTTPEPWDLPRILSLMHKRGIEYVVLESTSSGLDQNRLFGITFDSSCITNIGHDHLDYHKTWENYAKAKFKLIQKTKAKGPVVLNKDHESVNWLLPKLKKLNREVILSSKSDLKNHKYSLDGLSFEFENTQFQIPIIGDYNFENAMIAINVAQSYVSLEEISIALKTFSAPEGRMKVMQLSPFAVVVDFAHTPSSLKHALESVVKIKPDSNSKIICVFGCAGERDPERRKMGEVSSLLADTTILTIEDPRSEKLVDINNEIISYAVNSGGKLIDRIPTHIAFENQKEKLTESIKETKKGILSFDYEEVQNRIDAIEFALKIAEKNDIVFITGKGHEKSLAIGTPVIEIPYSDPETVKKQLNSIKDKLSL